MKSISLKALSKYNAYSIPLGKPSIKNLYFFYFFSQVYQYYLRRSALNSLQQQTNCYLSGHDLAFLHDALNSHSFL